MNQLHASQYLASILKRISFHTLLFIVIFLIPFYNIVAQCEEVATLIEKQRDLQQQLNELENIQPFYNQFHEVKRRIEELHEALKTTSEDLEEVRNKIENLMGQVREQNSELRNVRRWARSVYSNPDWEPDESSDLGGITLTGGLESAEGWINDFKSDIGKFKEALEILEIAVEARDERPSGQLEAFEEYFGNITELLKPYAYQVPILLPLIEMFDYFKTGINLIGGSVKIIEKEADKKDSVLRDAGQRFNNLSYSWPQATPAERFAKRKQTIRNELIQIENKLEECNVNITQKPTSKIEKSVFNVYRAADRRCEEKFGNTNEDDLIIHRNNILENLQDYYKVPEEPFIPIRYGSSMNSIEQVEYIQIQHNRWAKRVDFKKQELHQLDEELKRIEKRYQDYASGRLILPTEEAIHLNILRQSKREELEFKWNQFSELHADLLNRKRELDDLIQTQTKLNSYQICLREWMEDLAEYADVDKFWIGYEYRRLYRQHLQEFKEKVELEKLVGNWGYPGGGIMKIFLAKNNTLKAMIEKFSSNELDPRTEENKYGFQIGEIVLTNINYYENNSYLGSGKWRWTNGKVEWHDFKLEIKGDSLYREFLTYPDDNDGGIKTKYHRLKAN